MNARAFVVVDLGFGDAGKGTITDYLVRSRGASLVVRFNGGAQAGHNVVTGDGRHHTFSQFGSGTFVPGVRTHLAAQVVLHPSALLVENRRLESIGVPDAVERLTIAPTARVTTPYHQALGRLREVARGEGRHGTCGVGVGETVRDAISHPDDVLRAADLWTGRDALIAKLTRTRERLGPKARAELSKCDDVGAAQEEMRIFDDEGVVGRWMDFIAPLSGRPTMLAEEVGRNLPSDSTLVLEGAQGVLLDEDWGFHPHTTWSSCTTNNALTWLANQEITGPVHRVGVVRTYATRHGQGPLPSATPDLDHLDEPHNTDAGWQGRFHRGWPDPLLWRYALRATKGVDSLAVTHLDRVTKAGQWRVVSGYRGAGAETLDPSGEIRPRDPDDLPDREGLTADLLSAHAELTGLPGHHGTPPADRFVDWIEDALDVPVSITSHGPTAGDKSSRSRIAT
ncbi:MAG: adenylosuccinate synthetase [Deltaproteobacteria bacterium]|nr:MAG: adenylosuccinate synthetase [Deltaproteobacteria bacterium]